jgi:hypothetical protein
VQVGSLSWGGEHLLTVAYPLRRELIPTPAAVLGDDSLLLKYLNPHLAVVATMPAAADAAQGEPLTTVDDRYELSVVTSTLKCVYIYIAAFH